MQLYGSVRLLPWERLAPINECTWVGFFEFYWAGDLFLRCVVNAVCFAFLLGYLLPLALMIELIKYNGCISLFWIPFPSYSPLWERALKWRDFTRQFALKSYVPPKKLLKEGWWGFRLGENNSTQNWELSSFEFIRARHRFFSTHVKPAVLLKKTYRGFEEYSFFNILRNILILWVAKTTVLFFFLQFSHRNHKKSDFLP